MKPFVTLAQARTPDGDDISLHEHDSHFYLRVNRRPLMGTNASESEEVLAQVACKRLGGQHGARILIGGLGFGFTLRRVLELVRKDAVVDVAELLPEVIQWNHEFLQRVNGAALADARTKIQLADVFVILKDAPDATYDAIMLDVDNGPIAMVQDGNARLYQEKGFALLLRVLKPKGRVAFWSASQDNAFAKRLSQAGFKVEVIRAKSHPRARRETHTIFAADRKWPV